jgi:hypothetical protein
MVVVVSGAIVHAETICLGGRAGEFSRGVNSTMYWDIFTGEPIVSFQRKEDRLKV